MNKLNYGTNTNIYAAGDAKGLFKTAMRERFKQEGKDFTVWKDKVVIKLPKNKFFEVINDTVKRCSASSLVNTSHFTGYNVEVCLAPPHDTSTDNLVSNHDVLRLDVSMNYDEDGYESEPDSADKATQEILIAHMEAFGEVDLVNSFVKALRSRVKQEQEAGKSSLVSWVFSADDGAQERTFQIKKTWEIDQTFYPWIDTDLRDYYKAFIESRSQILVLYGPPGTGKTSFIRDMLCEMNLNAYISYDLKILTSDSTFVNYVTGSIFDAIVIEDADDLLTADREAQNKVIAKILNVSDGLIKLPRKKLIFSTNLNNVSDIDQAIIRPGRCFDVMEFRELTYDEAVATSKTLGVKVDEKKKYTLAELFFMKDVQENTDPFARKHGESLKKTIGFY